MTQSTVICVINGVTDTTICDSKDCGLSHKLLPKGHGSESKVLKNSAKNFLCGKYG